MKKGNNEVECPLESIANTITTSPKDWSLCKRDAWIYAIAVGWDECFEQVCERHKWDGETKDRLKRLREKWLELKENNNIGS